jgi:hypothetical protein
MAMKVNFADLFANLFSAHMTERLQRRGLVFRCPACGRLARDHSSEDVTRCSLVNGWRRGCGVQKAGARVPQGETTARPDTATLPLPTKD